MVLKNKKALKLVVCMSLIVALAISALSISVWAIYENTHFNSGNQAADIVGVAQTQVGYGEDYSGYTKYGDWYGLPNSDWCAMFVSWCANQAGIDTSVFPSFALCSAGCDWFMSQGRFHYSGSYIPQAGDLIFYASYGNIYHVGLVTGSDGSRVYSIEGNYSDMVSNVSYSLSYGDILGYATPAYNTTEYNNSYEDSDEWSDGDYNNDYYDSEDEEPYFEDSEEFDETDDIEDSDDSFEFTDVEDDEFSDVDSGEYDFEEDSDEFVTDTDVEVFETDSEGEFDYDSEAPAYASIIGDVDESGSVDPFDAVIIRRYLILDTTSEIVNFANADVDGSGQIDIGDALAILEISVGLR